MAILLEGSDGAPVMWGKIGDLLIQRTKRGTMYIRKYVKPANPRTVSQQRNRLAFTAGITRWRTHEKFIRKEYWDHIAGNHGFRDGYRAFISSFMTCYHTKKMEPPGEAAALDWVSNTGNVLIYVESPGKKEEMRKNEELVARVLTRRKSSIFAWQIQRAILYLQEKGWLGNLRYNLLPYANGQSEWEIIRLGLPL